MFETRIGKPAASLYTPSCSGIANAILVLILIYSIFASIQGLFSFSVNRIVGAFLIAVLLFDFINHLTRVKVIAACLLVIISSFSLLLFGSDPNADVEFLIYWICTLLLMTYISRPEAIASLSEAVQKRSAVVSACTLGCAALNAILLLSGMGYEPSWDGSYYYSGFSSGHHTPAAVACLLMSLRFLQHKTCRTNKVLTAIILAILAYAVFQTGARTFLVPVALLWCFFINDEKVVEHSWIRKVLMAAIIVVAIALFSTSSMATKFDYVIHFETTADRTLADNMTSGRLNYWETDLAAFFETSPLNQVFGNSASFVYKTNERVFHAAIWAHNDFVMVLCAAGYVGIVLYISVMCQLLTRVRKSITGWRFVAVVLYILFPAFFNGFYGYQHYVYSAVLLICALSWSSMTIGAYGNANC